MSVKGYEDGPARVWVSYRFATRGHCCPAFASRALC